MRTFLNAARALVYGSAFLFAWGWLALQVRRLDPALGGPLGEWARPAGIALMAAGGVLALVCAGLFVSRGRGTPAPFDPPRAFVAVGPYRWVRNPMYVGGLAVLLGFGLWHRSPGMALFTAVVWAAAHLFVVAVEEPGLARRFGAGYDAYRERVRRWLPRPPASR